MLYFKMRNGDPIRTKYTEAYGIENVEKAYVGKFLRVGDEPHDIDQIVGIMTQEQADAYFA